MGDETSKVLLLNNRPAINADLIYEEPRIIEKSVSMPIMKPPEGTSKGTLSMGNSSLNMEDVKKLITDNILVSHSLLLSLIT